MIEGMQYALRRRIYFVALLLFFYIDTMAARFWTKMSHGNSMY